MRPSRPRRTCSASVGDSSVERLALGAAIGAPTARSSASATGWAGTRTATVGPPAVVASGTAAFRGTTSVSGPGQKRRASRSATSGHAAATCFTCCSVGNVDDDGIVGRAALGGEDAAHGGRVQGEGAEAVDRLRREGDQSAAAQHRRRPRDPLGLRRVGVHGEDFGVHPGQIT